MRIGIDLANGPDATEVEFYEKGDKVGVVDESNGVPICRDFDEDCADLNHLNCYLYDPAKGKCPFLSKIKRT